MTTKIACGLAGCVAALPLMGDAVKPGVEHPASAERWGVFEIVLDGPDAGNPYVEVSLGATFTQGAVTKNVTGFYDGGSTYRIRFMPDALGAWSFTTKSSSPQLDGLRGSFTCTAPGAGNHGPVRVRERHHFAYEDGTPFFHVGTTSYNWLNQAETLQKQTLQTLGQSGFNKLRFLIMPKYYDFNKEPPAIWPFEGAPKAWDFDRPNVAFFQNHDRGIRQLRDMGVEADLILCNPYDGWGLKDIKDRPEQMDRYVKYVIARFSAYRNVWWSLANEYQLWSTDDTYWDALFQVVRDNDPHGHLRSIHNMFQVYDHTKPWVTHASLQEQSQDRHAPADFVMGMARELRAKYGKPIVWDEVKYEGNLPTKPDYFWGRLKPEEMTMRFWKGTIDGTYVGHSETYQHPENIIWWGKGGVLHGGSPVRIAFLRRLVERHVPGQRLDPVEGDATAAHSGTACYLHYYGESAASSRSFSLPAGQRYRAYVIDTWNMTQADAGVHAGSFSLALPENLYMAVLLVQEVP